MSTHHHPSRPSLRTPRESSEDGAGPVSVRLTSPPLSGVLRIVLILIAAVIALYLVWRLRGVTQLLVISLFFAFALFPVVDAVAIRTRAPRGVVILAVYVILALLVGLIGYVVIPSVVREVQMLSRDAPQYAAQLRRDATFRHYDDRYHITAKLLRDAHLLPQVLARAAGPLKDVTVGAASFATQLVTVLAVTFLLVLHGREYSELGLSLVGRRQQRYRQVIIDIKDAVARYTLGNTVISVLATVATWIVLSILGVPYALALGLVVGFFDLIPLVGATIGAIVVALATVPVSFPIATIVWIAFIIVWQRFEDYVVQPLVYGRALHVNPLVTIISLLVGAELLGILGVLLAIPSAAAIQIILREQWSVRGLKAPALGADGAAADGLAADERRG
ncbi:MAG: AI-2E family transporter [Solirubrobacterales bacterium]|nr:AI-2E family transporter [Solirubrobacterales bacterium]